jgi:adenylosuccinate lyase
MDSAALSALSPVDGRYRKGAEGLRAVLSESGLIRERIRIEAAWLLTLAVAQYFPYAITESFRYDIGRRNLPFAFFAIQAFFALIAGMLLYDNLVKRRFVLRT